MEKKKYLWREYLERFDYFREEMIREDCYPRKMLHPGPGAETVVLVHGLTDSPGMMMDLARYFHDEMGCNVYLPLLQGHGLREPDGMAGVSLESWKENVRFAVQSAAESNGKLSIGGLSTGGALAFYFGCLDPGINRKIFLFSAALGLSGGWFGSLKEGFLRSPLCLPFCRLKMNLIGPHPYRYSYVPLCAARELALLQQELDGLRSGVRPCSLSGMEIFNAWSECDNVIDTGLLSRLGDSTTALKYDSYVIGRKHRVEHASVVLKHSVHAPRLHSGGRRLLEKANPVFDDMVEAMNRK
jgi:pimeloyl-ACP methyl ester carboxylesterase